MDFKDKIVRYHIALQGKYLSSVKKADIKQMIMDRGAFFVSKINIEPIFDRLVRNDEVLSHRSDIEKTKAFINSQPHSISFLSTHHHKADYL